MRRTFRCSPLRATPAMTAAACGSTRSTGRRAPQRHETHAAIPPGEPVLEIDHLQKHYKISANEIFGKGERRTVKANEDISLVARAGETVAIVGESGCGKSTLAKVLLGLETATGGKVKLAGHEIQSEGVEARDTPTVSSIQMVFQNPFDTLNPSHTVGSQIMRTLEKFGIGNNNEERRNRMLELLDLVKLPRAFEHRMPRQLSGGQKQRIGVARAFAGKPRVVIADEPMSALDVSVQAAVTELLMDIQRTSRTTMVFISHDLSIVRYLSDRVVVMYLGYVVEQGTTDQIFEPPYHPYTEALLSAIPIADTRYHQAARGAGGRYPLRHQPAAGLPVPDALPAQAPGAGHAVRDGTAAAAQCGRRAPDPLPSLGGDPQQHGPGDRGGTAGGDGVRWTS